MNKRVARTAIIVGLLSFAWFAIVSIIQPGIVNSQGMGGGPRWYSYVPTIASKAVGATSKHGHALNGDPADSLAGGAAETTSVFPVFGARKFVVYYRDSTDGAGTPFGGGAYTDSVSLAIQFSAAPQTSVAQTAGWSGVSNAGGWNTATAMNDTLGVAQIGKSNGTVSIAGASQTLGYLTATMYGTSSSSITATFLPFGFTARWARLIFTNVTRKRNPSSTENAALLGLRVRVHVQSDVDPYISRWAE